MIIFIGISFCEEKKKRVCKKKKLNQENEEKIRSSTIENESEKNTLKNLSCL